MTYRLLSKITAMVALLLLIGSLVFQFPLVRLALKLPDLLGFNQTRTYFVLFQNNTELRPTGGFLGSYGILTLNRGRPTLQVQDIYVPDGQVTSHITPPAPIQEAFQLGTWRLRDANWKSDFPSAAKHVEWFMEKAGLPPADGTIATNLLVVQELVKLLGPITLPDYNETISAQSLWEKTQLYSQHNSFPGSKQKTEFLSDLSEQLLENISRANIVTKLKIIRSLLVMLEEKQLLVSVHDSSTQQILENLNWSGSIKEPSCPWWAGNCIRDSLFFTEANLGVNKANCCLERSASLSTVAENGVLKRQLTLTVKNLNNKNSRWGGPYRAWVSVYFLGEERGGWLFVPEEETASITFDYETLLDERETGRYILLVQKQSGIISFPLSVSFINDKNTSSKTIEIYKDKLIML